jgi:macrodomain Ter protein organizer (MatP/YcbG family)
LCGITFQPNKRGGFGIRRIESIGKQLSSLPHVILTCIWHFFDLKGISSSAQAIITVVSLSMLLAPMLMRYSVTVSMHVSIQTPNRETQTIGARKEHYAHNHQESFYRVINQSNPTQPKLNSISYYHAMTLTKVIKTIQQENKENKKKRLRMVKTHRPRHMLD